MKKANQQLREINEMHKELGLPQLRPPRIKPIQKTVNQLADIANSLPKFMNQQDSEKHQKIMDCINTLCDYFPNECTFPKIN